MRSEEVFSDVDHARFAPNLAGHGVEEGFGLVAELLESGGRGLAEGDCGSIVSLPE